MQGMAPNFDKRANFVVAIIESVLSFAIACHWNVQLRGHGVSSKKSRQIHSKVRFTEICDNSAL